MSDFKNFEFATERAAKVQLAGQFGINGQKFDVKVINDTNIAYLIASITGGGDDAKIIAKVLNFMEEAMTPESAKAFEALALGNDGGKGLKLAQVVEVFKHVLTIAAGGTNPTGGSSASASRRRSTGARSTISA